MKKGKGRKAASGQLSLEFALLLAAFFSFFLVLAPAMAEVLDTGEYGVDAKNAELFLDQAKNAAGRLDAFGDGSTEEIRGAALHDWRVTADNQTLSIEIARPEDPKRLEAALVRPLTLAGQTVRGRFSLRLEKNAGTLSGTIKVDGD